MLEKELMAVDGETLWDLEFSAQRLCIHGLLPQGLCILGGAPKIGKSWLVEVRYTEPVTQVPQVTQKTGS